jgi:tetratricopeptide (TPR) repeat protein
LLNGEREAGLSGLRAAVAKDALLVDPALHSEPAVRGIAALRSGQVAEAIAALKQAVALVPGSSEAHRLLGTAEHVGGDIASALGHWRDAVRLDPKNERAWLSLTSALDDLRNWTEEVAVLREAINAVPGSAELRWQLMVLSGKQQRTDAAALDLIATADHLTLFVGTAELYSRVAKLAQAHLEYERAVALLQQAVALTPNNAKAHQALGRAYIDQGRADEGCAELVISLWLDPADVETLTTIGRLHLTTGDYPGAIETLTRAVSLDPADPQVVNALGEALVRGGSPDAGRQHVETAERLQARAVEAQRRARTAGMLSLQAELQMTQRDFAGASDLWRQAAELETRDVSMRLRLADALIAAGRGVEAATELQRAIPLNAGADAHRLLAEVYAALGQSEDSARERRLYTDARLRQLQERAGEIQ